jgi:hypothetical protein
LFIIEFRQYAARRKQIKYKQSDRISRTCNDDLHACFLIRPARRAKFGWRLNLSLQPNTATIYQRSVWNKIIKPAAEFSGKEILKKEFFAEFNAST